MYKIHRFAEMLMNYKQCIEKYGSQYQLDKVLSAKQVFQLEKGVYSDKKYENELGILRFKYPNAVITMDSAFYFHDLTDTIPEKTVMATNRGSAKISDSRVIQRFENSDTLMLGAIEADYHDSKILIYSKERMLVELLRNKNVMPFDLYKEVLGNYRKQIYDLNFRDIEDYAERIPKSQMILKALQLEVM
ncbi:MAG: hypothetical protein MJ184_12625 [Treponema sp.]|uniref:type IV toxin-antitoxin system AbiEi family antitoxin domain-containing protein n=1 Tax=Treponema sp. TaxID=166 RepID=UPI00298E1B2D|nr:hypothetical protein [Treponema sp.]MCQ2602198.1 hypothetical protein [Treponema sp.]